MPVLARTKSNAPEPGWARKIFDAYSVRDVLDVGANVGGFIHGWLDAGATTVHAIEPVPACFHKLEALYENDVRVKPHRVGVSDAPGMIKDANVFHCWTLLPDQGETNRHGHRAVGRAAAEGIDRAVDFVHAPPFDVELATIDSLLERWSFAPDFIKIDVDGYDARALRGGMRYIRAQRPIMMIELSYYPEFLDDCCECMVRSLYELGYVLTKVNGGERFETLKAMMRSYPWDTSFDVIAEPEGDKI